MSETKEVKLQLTIEVNYECPIDWSSENVKFHLEENFCISNLIEKMYEEMKAGEEKGQCHICHRAKVKVLEMKDANVYISPRFIRRFNEDGF